ncbi:MAG TPA: RDD family protein [Dehalococcoidales bacterium]
MDSKEGPAPVNPQPAPHQDNSIERDLGLVVKICPGCRTSNLPTSKYCYKCGLALPEEKDLGKAVKICAGCHTANQPESQYCFKCGLKLPDQVTFPGMISMAIPAGFWRRFASFIIDNIFIAIGSLMVFSIVFAILFSIFPDLADKYRITEYSWNAILTASEAPMTWLDWLTYLGGIVIDIVYWTVAIGWKGRTLGKFMLGMKVVKTDGSRVGYLRAFGRYWGYVLCNLTLGFGFLAIAWNKQKRGLHDFICDTMVVKI